MAILPTDLDATNPDNDTRPSVKAHQQHHDELHAAHNNRVLHDGLRYTYLWNGTNYVDTAAVAATSANRVANTYRYFIGPSDPNALGLMVDGDVWLPTA